MDVVFVLRSVQRKLFYRMEKSVCFAGTFLQPFDPKIILYNKKYSCDNAQLAEQIGEIGVGKYVRI